MKIKFAKLVLLFVFGILVCAIWSNIIVYAQNKTATGVVSPTSTAPKSHAIRITSPIRGQQVPVGKDLAISGTTLGSVNSTSNCQVSVIVNNVKPYQNVAAAGNGGPTDFSKWNYVLTSKYTTIKEGQNKISARYLCDNNAVRAFYSVNVTGTTTGAMTAAVLPPRAPSSSPSGAAALPSVGNSAASTNKATLISKPVQKHNQPVTEMPSAASTSAIAPQVKALPPENAINQKERLATVNNSTARQNNMSSSLPPVAASDKLMYLGYHGSNNNNGGSITNNDLTANSPITKSVSKRSGSTDNSLADSSSIDMKSNRHKDTNISTSQININRNTDNGNDNFIFPFSYP